VKTPFDLFEFKDCGPPLFIENNVAPAPSQLVGSAHGIPGASLYDVEFGGFTKRLTRETSNALAAGTYRVKIVIQDVADTRVDSGVFLDENSLKLFSFRYSDLNLDGVVDLDDKAIITSNFGESPATYWDGDLSGNGTVDTADNVVWAKFNGMTGNANLQADFNRDGCVNNLDLAILNTYEGLDHCASRFEGDADGDGDVDANDEDIYDLEVGNCN
jgi:hypothetical protein